VPASERTIRHNRPEVEGFRYPDSACFGGPRSVEGGLAEMAQRTASPHRDGDHLAVTGAYVASGLIGSLRSRASSEISASIDPIYP
jgi:hypothetical protein